MKDVSGKVAFVTGGASGMGLAMARSFSAAGMKVVIADIEQAALDRASLEFKKTNAQVIALRVNVTDRDAMERAAQETEKAFGKVHVVCNNAGVAVGGSLETMSYKDWDWVLGVNLGGVINGVQTFVERIRSHGEGGHIVNTASMAGHIALTGFGIYNTTKYAVVGLSETLRADLAAQNIGVSVLCPGVVTTNMPHSGRNRPDELKGEVDTSLVMAAHEADPDRMQALLAASLDPAVVGDMVLAAIQANDPYIFTHPDMAEMIGNRHKEIETSVARWAGYRKKHGI